MYDAILNQRHKFVAEVMAEELDLLEGATRVKIGPSYVEYFEPGWDSFFHRINLFELGYKAKQWMLRSGYIVSDDMIINLDTQEVVLELEDEDIREAKMSNPLADIKICLIVYDYISLKGAKND